MDATSSIQALALVLTGYSLPGALALILTQFRRTPATTDLASALDGDRIASAAGIALLATLATLQAIHFAYLYAGWDLVQGPAYRMLLFCVAPAFYLFVRPLLGARAGPRPWMAVHLLPPLGAPALASELAIPLSFGIGAGYLLWLALRIYGLRAERQRFQLELGLLAGMLAIAVAVLVLGLCVPLIPEVVFFGLYASAIGGALFLVQLMLGYAPRLSSAVADVARETYQTSTLARLDCDALLERLRGAMETERLYLDPGLDMPTLARHLGIRPHQLSELINTRLGKGFSRYLREHRVAAAQAMLLAEPEASVLAIGLSVGFASQSTFYEAFREIAGTTPGRYRQIRSGPTESKTTR